MNSNPGGAKFPAGSWILSDQPGLHDAIAVDRSRTRPRLHRSRHCPGRSASHGDSSAYWRVGSVGRHRLDRMDPLLARSAQSSLHLSARRRHPRRKPALDASTCCSTDTSISNSPSRSKACRRRWSPMPFKKTPQTPSFGTPAESDDITGGIGYEGLAQIQHFVDDGGLMVTLGSGSMLALEGGLVRFVRRSSGGVPRSAAGGGGASAAAAQTSRHAHSRRACPRHLRSPRPSHRLRISRAHLGLPPEFSALQHPAPLAAHGLLHHLPRWSRRPQRHRDGVGRHRRQSRSSKAARPGEKKI